ncbi:hypothetical protein F4824DRAFT_74788 [Ustulina deusta]|nr:hypothetical protein F4824DRAFT_74788 [Ustulina deusta]
MSSNEATGGAAHGAPPPGTPRFPGSRSVLALFEDRDKDFLACKEVISATTLAIDTALASPAFIAPAHEKWAKRVSETLSAALIELAKGGTTSKRPASPSSPTDAPPHKKVTIAQTHTHAEPTTQRTYANIAAQPARGGRQNPQNTAVDTPAGRTNNNGPTTRPHSRSRSRSRTRSRTPASGGDRAGGFSDESDWTTVGGRPKRKPKTTRSGNGPRVLLRISENSELRSLNGAEFRIRLCASMKCGLAAYPVAMPIATGWSIRCADEDAAANLLKASSELAKWGITPEADEAWSTYIISGRRKDRTTTQSRLPLPARQ